MAGSKAAPERLRVALGDPEPKAQQQKRKQYSPGETAGITVGAFAAVIAVVGLYIGASKLWATYKQGKRS